MGGRQDEDVYIRVIKVRTPSEAAAERNSRDHGVISLFLEVPSFLVWVKQKALGFWFRDMQLLG